MDRELAVNLMAAIQAAEPGLEKLSHLWAQASDDLRRRELRQIGMVMSSYLHMTMAIVRQFPELDPDGNDTDGHAPSQSASISSARSDVTAIREVLVAAKSDLGKVASLSRRIGAKDERTEFLNHVATASTLYDQLTEALTSWV